MTDFDLMNFPFNEHLDSPVSDDTGERDEQQIPQNWLNENHVGKSILPLFVNPDDVIKRNFSNVRDSSEENKPPSMDRMNYARNTNLQESPGLQERSHNGRHRSTKVTESHKGDVPNFIHSTPREDSSAKHFTKANERGSSQTSNENLSPDLSIEDCNGATVPLQASLSKEDLQILESVILGYQKRIIELGKENLEKEERSNSLQRELDIAKKFSDKNSNNEKKLEEKTVMIENITEEFSHTKELLEKAKDTIRTKQTALLSLTDSLRNVELFTIPIGILFFELYDSEDASLNLDGLLREKYPNIIGFLRQSHLDEQNRMSQRLENAKSENSDLQNELENKKSEIQAIREKNNNLLGTNKTLSKQNKVLCDKFEKLSNDEKEMLKGCNEEIKTKLESLNERLGSWERNKESYEAALKDKDQTIGEFEKKTNSMSKELTHLKSRLGNLEGNTSERITIKEILQSRSDISVEECNLLMIEQIDSACLTDLQNIVKEIVLAIGIPYSKLRRKIPLLAIKLKYESILLSNFAQRLHRQIYNQEMNLKKFTDQAYYEFMTTRRIDTIDHHLERCLDHLYDYILEKMVR
ncbi:hypothetical protein SEUBUCD646_0N01060 [Saccharomyces eubayanus]|uniref:Chaotic nuclear migration-protein n=2 Tax=Saccharomyces TaxID=4930 RepID=A0A6C1EEQ2_SACPS|nr:Chaotic nuclear migration- protein [Saccharomyces pastorianus]CAI1671525.1 hypothetical protein SEUBUCD650_0N01060 [Saccharomyces eubayanus]CAI1702475.1 hypothetical protein SEUBUCD646_0N01060 [Saccharomyces eubayanus]